MALCGYTRAVHAPASRRCMSRDTLRTTVYIFTHVESLYEQEVTLSYLLSYRALSYHPHDPFKCVV